MPGLIADPIIYGFDQWTEDKTVGVDRMPDNEFAAESVPADEAGEYESLREFIRPLCCQDRPSKLKARPHTDF